jgi:hypothetical protein
MPDKRHHRGPHPEDARLFAPNRWPDLRSAVSDLAWLLSHDYSMKSALKLVGDHYQLDERQRLAVMRSTCSDASLALRRANERGPADITGQPLAIDGYNLLTTVEAALGGGILLRGRDGCFRDMASLHGHYKRVLETEPALLRIGRTIAALNAGHATLYLDAPVSNSGRLKKMMEQTAAESAWHWTITLVQDPDPLLARSPHIVVTADSVILDGTRLRPGESAPRWFNLASRIIADIATVAIVDLSL